MEFHLNHLLLLHLHLFSISAPHSSTDSFQDQKPSLVSQQKEINLQLTLKASFFPPK